MGQTIHLVFKCVCSSINWHDNSLNIYYSFIIDFLVFTRNMQQFLNHIFANICTSHFVFLSNCIDFTEPWQLIMILAHCFSDFKENVLGYVCVKSLCVCMHSWYYMEELLRFQNWLVRWDRLPLIKTNKDRKDELFQVWTNFTTDSRVPFLGWYTSWQELSSVPLLR